MNKSKVTRSEVIITFVRSLFAIFMITNRFLWHEDFLLYSFFLSFFFECLVNMATFGNSDVNLGWCVQSQKGTHDIASHMHNYAFL